MLVEVRLRYRSMKLLTARSSARQPNFALKRNHPSAVRADGRNGKKQAAQAAELHNACKASYGR